MNNAPTPSIHRASPSHSAGSVYKVVPMPSAAELLNRQYLEMRARVLSLAADFDRLQRAAGGDAALNDQRVEELRTCLREVLSPANNRAERVQMILSDQSPPPERD